jgi:hypothetical protein
MDTTLTSFFSNLWPILWPLLALAVVWILIRFIFKLAFRVMVSGCFLLLLLGAALFFFRVVR